MDRAQILVGCSLVALVAIGVRFGPAIMSRLTVPVPSDFSGESALAKAVRDAMTQAQHDLVRVDYLRLSNENRKDYDTAKYFLERANAAMTEGKLIYAQTLADKASSLASQLVGRIR